MTVGQQKLNTDRSVAIDPEYTWRAINDQTPRGVKLQLIRKPDGVAVYGHYNPKDKHWTHWAPLPTFAKG